MHTPTPEPPRVRARADASMAAHEFPLVLATLVVLAWGGLGVFLLLW